MSSEFTVYDASGRARAFIEARRRIETSTAWATQLRRNLLAHGQVPADAVFVLVTLDKLYCWPPSLELDDQPSFEGDVRMALAPYFARVDTSPESVEPEAFEILVSWWLKDLARGAPPDGELAQGLAGSGLLAALAGARVVRQDAA